uniref:Hemerythrin n=4 Tax=Lophotrochozoa TaxID=1206795 RepID=A0A1S6QCT5_9ANNE|nr:hemerythrin [Oenone fulgida]AQV13717.1 hemerythrin [Oligochaeta sp. EP-2017]AQV13721.1 hemerythrin [Paralvinella palmiformis]ASW22277.1 hemerythrin [Leptochiton rugatus]
MANTIPEPFEWSEEFQVFYESLDNEHKGLFKGVAACAKNNNADNLKELKKVIEKHFRNEEKEMDKSCYDCVAHKKAHGEFEAVLAGLAVPIPDDKIKYAKQWLVDHIKGTDFKYKGKLTSLKA